MKFLFDENFDHHLVELLAATSNAEVAHIKEHLPEGVQDERIKQFAANHGYVIVTEDFRDFWGSLSDFSVLVLCGKLCHLRSRLLADWLIEHWPRIEAALAEAEHPLVASIYYSGRLKIARK